MGGVRFAGKIPARPGRKLPREVNWPHDFKLLEDARNRLQRAQKSGDVILEEVQQVMEKLQIKSG